jgi:hypothetical protein
MSECITELKEIRKLLVFRLEQCKLKNFADGVIFNVMIARLDIVIRQLEQSNK